MRIYHRLFSKYAIRLKGGRAVALKGKLTMSHLREVEGICRDAGIADCELWSNGVDRITFSDEVPAAVQQRLRNAIFAFLK